MIHRFGFDMKLFALAIFSVTLRCIASEAYSDQQSEIEDPFETLRAIEETTIKNGCEDKWKTKTCSKIAMLIERRIGGRFGRGCKGTLIAWVDGLSRMKVCDRGENVTRSLDDEEELDDIAQVNCIDEFPALKCGKIRKWHDWRLKTFINKCAKTAKEFIESLPNFDENCDKLINWLHN